MKISDFIDNIEDVEDSGTTPVDLDDIEKTAELLEQFAKEDTLLDELAKLAVLQDVVGNNKEQLEKIGVRIFGMGERSAKQLANFEKSVAQKELRLAEIAEDTRKINAEAEKLRQKSKAMADKADNGGSMLDSAVPYVVGGAAGALGAGAYFKNRENKMLEEIAAYYNSQQANPTKTK